MFVPTSARGGLKRKCCARHQFDAFDPKQPGDHRLRHLRHNGCRRDEEISAVQAVSAVCGAVARTPSLPRPQVSTGAGEVVAAHLVIVLYQDKYGKH